VKLASEYQVPVIPFGVGSSLEGHLLAVQGGISIDLTRMNKVLSINAEDLTVTVQPGVTRKQLNEEIKSTGLFFPIDPGADATLGGMSATRASGTNAVRYGTMRENVLALEVVTASGEVIRTGTRAKKSSAGYDLTRLFVGSEGTLGVLTEITVRLYPLPEAISAAICSFPSIAAAVQTVIQIIQLGVPIARVELIDHNTVRMVNAYAKLGLREEPMLLMEFHGSPAGVKERPWRQRFRMGHYTRGAHTPLDGSPQRLLCSAPKQARLPRHQHRYLCTHQQVGRLSARLHHRNRRQWLALFFSGSCGRWQFSLWLPHQP
jgi:D-lactate dehydrogenase (cytochrome)